MGKTFKLPQEIEVWYIIPTMRKEFSIEFSKKYGFSYDKIAGILGVTKAAVSQYIWGKRAGKVTLSREIKDEIKISAKKIVENNSKFLIEIQTILKKMRSAGGSCQICKKYNKEALNYCNSNPMY